MISPVDLDTKSDPQISTNRSFPPTPPVLHRTEVLGTEVADRSGLSEDVSLGTSSRQKFKVLKKSRLQNKGISDLKVVFRFEGYLRVKSQVFENSKSPLCQKLFSDFVDLEGVTMVKINPLTRTCLVKYLPNILKEKTILALIENVTIEKETQSKPEDRLPAPKIASKGRAFKLSRSEKLLTEWEVLHSIPGRLRIRHSILDRNKFYCQHVEKILFGVSGVDKVHVNPITTSVLVIYDEKKVNRFQLLNILDTTLKNFKTKRKNKKDGPQTELALASASMALAGVSTLAVPALLPLNAALVFLTAGPSFKGACQVIFKEKRIGVDILDSIITMACLVTGQVFAGALMVWTLSIGRHILGKTTERSSRALSEVMGKQPTFAWLVKDGVEIQVSVDTLKSGDLIVVNTGDAIPVDGEIDSGEAMVDQHALTGESAPAEKKKGDKAFASTLVIAGMLYINVKEAGENTTAAKIKQIIERSANFKVKTQSVGEKLADKAVLPTLGLATVGFLIRGQSAGLAIINCDYGTGIRIAAPTALLSSLIVCARNGILIKNGRVLENLPQVDTFIFDKTGTLTHEVPEVREIICNDGLYKSEDILKFAAIAEQRFNHPIANAILKRAEELNLHLPKKEDTKYNIGFGIEVSSNGHRLKVGSRRYMERESIKISSTMEDRLHTIREKGGTVIYVAVNDVFAGALELESSHRAEAFGIIQGLRGRGVKKIALISGDHKAPTQALAEKLGIDEYYAEVLPADKLKYVKMFQRQGRKVAFVGDGINDSPALSKADVSISLRGASDIATDVADVVFMDGGLSKMMALYEISQNLKINVDRSYKLIVVPNTLCIFGAMFGVFGLAHSIIMNNIANLMATFHGTLPLKYVHKDQPMNMSQAAKEILITDKGNKKIELVQLNS